MIACLDTSVAQHTGLWSTDKVSADTSALIFRVLAATEPAAAEAVPADLSALGASARGWAHSKRRALPHCVVCLENLAGLCLHAASQAGNCTEQEDH